MIAARQEVDLRPQLERLDALMLRSEGLDPDAMTFAFRPLWQLDAPARAALALTKAQATQVYAGLGQWPAEVMARLAEAQLVQDGTYPNAAAVFAEGDAIDLTGTRPTLDFDPDQPRDPDGRWTGEGDNTYAGVRRAPDGTPISLAASADDPQGLKIAKAAASAAGLSRPQRRIFHNAITGQGITDYQELLSIAMSVKRGEYP